MRQKSKKELFIIDHYYSMTSGEIAKILDIPVTQIEYYANKNNLRKGRFSFTEEENQYMKDNYLIKSYKEIADVLGYSEKQIRSRINNMGLTKNRKINNRYFQNIDTPLKAYFLGFIFADSWIVCNEKLRHYEFGMELQSSDKYILEKLNNELGGLNIIYHSNPHETIICGNLAHSGHTDYLRVYSKPLILDLRKHGIETNKSQKPNYPIVSDELFYDFLRGYIDGDGCYWKYKGHYYMHITCAFPNILYYIQNKLLLSDIKTQVYKETDKKYRLMCTNITDMKKLINLLYPSSNILCLKRKYNKIKSYLTGLAA